MELLEFLKTLNWQTLLAIFAILWYFTNDFKSEIRKLEMDLKSQGARTDRLYEMFIDLLKERK